ncbi:hypothetical protein HAX54_017112, partial [Datura stramonium]|nr:hypothetical protein [Datura stramonium]
PVHLGIWRRFGELTGKSPKEMRDPLAPKNLKGDDHWCPNRRIVGIHQLSLVITDPGEANHQCDAGVGGFCLAYYFMTTAHRRFAVHYLHFVDVQLILPELMILHFYLDIIPVFLFSVFLLLNLSIILTVSCNIISSFERNSKGKAPITNIDMKDLHSDEAQCIAQLVFGLDRMEAYYVFFNEKRSITSEAQFEVESFKDDFPNFYNLIGIRDWIPFTIPVGPYFPEL